MTITGLYERAVALLARREHSRLELKRKLLARGYVESEVVAVIQRLVDEGLQSDERFAQAYIRNRINLGYGPRYITQELQLRGVHSDTVAQNLNYDEVFWFKMLAKVWQKKYHDSLMRDARFYAAQTRFLLQRGFDPQLIYRWMENLRAETIE